MTCCAGCSNKACPLDEFIELTEANIPIDLHAECNPAASNGPSQNPPGDVDCVSKMLGDKIQMLWDMRVANNSVLDLNIISS